MEYEKLIEYIVKELYNKLDQLPITAPRKKAVILWDKDLAPYSVLSSEYEIIAYDQQLTTCDVVILPQLCLRGLYNLSQGSCTSYEESFVLKMLMEGKQVFVLKEGMAYRTYKATAPKALYNKYVKYEEELVAFGVQIIEDLSEVMAHTKEYVKQESPQISHQAVEVPVEKAFELTNKRLISETDLRKLKYSGITTVKIDESSIITPLANDFIRMNHLKIQRV